MTNQRQTVKQTAANILRVTIAAAVMLIAATGEGHAQTSDPSYDDDSLFVAPPLIMPQEDSVAIAVVADTTTHKAKRDWSTWRPNPKRALWLALVLPGAGQIYNRKYWKLPIFYGGFLGCAYAISWNNRMFRDYAKAYMDISDNDPNTQSYNTFLHLGNTVTEANKKRYQELFRKRKDRFRRYRDLSCFIMIGVYALSVVDAYVDASLSEFDISDDLSLRVAPAVFSDQSQRNSMKPSGLGLGCNLTF